MLICHIWCQPCTAPVRCLRQKESNQTQWTKGTEQNQVPEGPACPQSCNMRIDLACVLVIAPVKAAYRKYDFIGKEHVCIKHDMQYKMHITDSSHLPYHIDRHSWLNIC